MATPRPESHARHNLVQPTMRVTLERQGSGTHEIRIDQVTTENLRRLFQVNPAESWLKDELDGTVYFPMPNGNFDLREQRISPYATLTVEGPDFRGPLPPPRPLSTSLSSTQLSSDAAGSSGLQQTSPNWRSVISPKRLPTFNLKVVKAEMKKIGKKIEFTPISQTFIELIDSTANLENITGIIQRRWGSNYVLMTQDGLKLEESPSLNGLSFWKSPRRKILAVANPSEGVSSDELEDSEPRPKKRKGKKLEEIMEGLASIKNSIDSVSTERLPLCLLSALQQNFKCTICHAFPIQPPVMVALCCKTIVGCEACTIEWYSGQDGSVKTCPLCRAEEGNSQTMKLNGVDDFMTTISNIYSGTTAD